MSPLLTSLDSADYMNGNVTGARMVLEALEHLPSVEARHVDVQRNGVGTVFVCGSETGVAVEADDSLESLVARHSQQNLGETGIVLHNQHGPVTGLDRLVVVLHHILGRTPLRNGACLLLRFHALRRRRTPRGADPWRAWLVDRGWPPCTRLRQRVVTHWEEQCERTALPRCALDSNFSAQQSRDFTTDRKTKPGTAKFAARCSVGLLERFKNQELLVACDPHARICDRERYDTAACVERGLKESSLRLRHTDPERNAPFRGELHCVGEKILEYLLHPLGVDVHRCRHTRRHLHLKPESFLHCYRTEAPVERRIELGYRSLD